MSTTVRDIGSDHEEVGRHANKRRWYVLRYLRTCTYPATIGELSEYVGPRVGVEPAGIEGALRDRDLPTLADCDAIEYDPQSDLASLDDRASFADRVRRAIDADALTHLKPPRLGRHCRGVFY